MKPSHTCASCRWYHKGLSQCRAGLPQVVPTSIQSSSGTDLQYMNFNVYLTTQWPGVSSQDWCRHHSEITEEEKVIEALQRE